MGFQAAITAAAFLLIIITPASILAIRPAQLEPESITSAAGIDEPQAIPDYGVGSVISGTGFEIPGAGAAGAFGYGVGGPNGGSSAGGGVVNEPFQCPEPSRCLPKQMTCPQNCFQSFSHSGKGYGFGGGGGGCNFDCHACTATCSSK
ncbi:unnamed protein product [Cuscuta europaea]|uniref:Uncharacterized protein n=1 Tax=Cuscuta europaea TaxID=41803 RepID=A0A9P0YIV6_CUSEU|nr:unnamed protein product [Cuscuta europaea]